MAVCGHVGPCMSPKGGPARGCYLQVQAQALGRPVLQGGEAAAGRAVRAAVAELQRRVQQHHGHGECLARRVSGQGGAPGPVRLLPRPPLRRLQPLPRRRLRRAGRIRTQASGRAPNSAGEPRHGLPAPTLHPRNRGVRDLHPRRKPRSPGGPPPEHPREPTRPSPRPS